jgi:hypothetical protein
MSTLSLTNAALAFQSARTSVETLPEFAQYTTEKKAFGALVKGAPDLAKQEIYTLDTKSKKKIIEWLKHPAQEPRETSSEAFQAAHKSFAAAFATLKPVQTYQDYRMAKKEFKIEVKAFLSVGKSVEELQKAILEAHPDMSAKVINKVAYYHYKMTH